MKIKWNKIYRALKKELNCEVKKEVELKKHTTFRIGGKAKIMIFPTSQEDVIKAFFLIRELPYYVLGGGSNVLACDEEYEGVVVNLRQFSGIAPVENGVEVLAGTSIAQVCKYYERNSFTGMEKLFGIPGTIGGAAVMNAGANGGQLSDIVIGVLAISDGRIKYFSKEECLFGYRQSVFKKDAVILKVFLSCKRGDKEQITKTMKESLEKKISTQPLNQPSAGSVFKRKDNIIVSKMIDCEGLKGYNINDAEISTKHAGFIVNKGNASCKDVLALIDFLKKYFIRKGIELEEEICILQNDYRRKK